MPKVADHSVFKKSEQSFFLTKRFIIFMLFLSGLSLWFVSFMADLKLATLSQYLIGSLWLLLILLMAAMAIAVLWVLIRHFRRKGRELPKEASETSPSIEHKASHK